MSFRYTYLNKYIDSLVNKKLDNKFFIDEDEIEEVGYTAVERGVCSIELGDHWVELNLEVTGENKMPELVVVAGNDEVFDYIEQYNDRVNNLDFSDPNWNKSLFNTMTGIIQEHFGLSNQFADEIKSMQQTYGAVKKYQPKTRDELKDLCDDLTVDLSDIDTSKITDMEGIFLNSQRSNDEFAGIETWDVSNVINMSGMFLGAKNFNRDISDWDVRNVKNFSSFLEGTSFDYDISDWDVSNAEDLYDFMANCPYSHDLSKWLDPDNPNGINIRKVYPECVQYNTERYFNGSTAVNPTGNFSEIFLFYSGAFDKNDIEYPFEDPEHQNLAKIYGSKIFKNVDWNKINEKTKDWTIQTTNKEILKQFVNDEKISNLQKLDVSLIDDLSGLFENSERIDFSGIEKWDVSNCECFAQMFKGSKCQADLRSWNIRPNADIYEMFYDSKMPEINMPVTVKKQYEIDKKQQDINDAYASFNSEKVNCSELFTSNSKYFDNLKINDNLFNHLGMFYKDLNADNKALPIHQVVKSYLADNNLSLSIDEIVDTTLAFKVSLTASKLFEANGYSDYSFPKSRLQEFVDVCDHCNTAEKCSDYAHSAFKNLQKVQKVFFPENREELRELCDNDSVNLNDIDVSKITDMSEIFSNTARKDFSGIENWDVSNVTNFFCMFSWATDVGNIDLSKWDTSNVQNMSRMFEYSNFTGDISSWDVSKVKDMSRMFDFCTTFNGDLSGWDVSNVTDMSRMFYGSAFNGDISGWDVSNVINMRAMFYRAKNFNKPLDDWNVSNVIHMDSMFKGAEKFNQALDSWDVSNVKSMYGMFSGAKSFNQSLDTWKIKDECSIKYFADKCPIENDLTKLPKAVVEVLINWNDEAYTQEQLHYAAEKFGLDISYINPKPIEQVQTEEQSLVR